MNPSQSQPHYYAVIPADVRYCKDLESNAKLLYGEITALCNKEGYCWASNKYFAELYDVEIRTVQRWLKSLSDNKFIFISNEQDENKQSIRKIYLKDPSQIIYGGDKNVMGGVTKMSWGGDKNVAPSIYNTTTNVVVVGETPCFVVDSERKITKDDVYHHSLAARTDWVPEEIEEAWQAYINAKHPVSDPIKYIDGIINKKRVIATQKNKEKRTCQSKYNNHKTFSNVRSENTNQKPMECVTSEQILGRFA